MHFGEFFFCIIFSCHLYRTCWSSTRYNVFNLKDAFAGRVCGIDDVIPFGNVWSKIGCAFTCFKDVNCLSFFFKSETKQCFGCCTGYGVNNADSPTEDLAGSIYYTGYRWTEKKIHLKEDIVHYTFVVKRRKRLFFIGGQWRLGNVEIGYLGCFHDNPRLLETMIYSKNMTTEICVQTCVQSGNVYAMTEAECWCLCGNVLLEQLSETNCTQQCGGDSSQICGDLFKGSLYTTGP